jgi:hypothetical protein
MLGLKASELQDAPSNRYKIPPREVIEPFIRAFELMLCPRYRQVHTTHIRCAIIIQDPKKKFVGMYAGMGYFFDKVRVILIAG